MPLPKVTIKEIAKLAEVSTTSVSFVLNGRNGVSAATKEKILRVIKETGYYPNAASQRLVRRKSFNIAFIYTEDMSPFSDLFYNEVANGLVETLTRNRYNVVFVPLQANNGDSGIPDIINKQDADGAVFLYDAPTAILDRMDGSELPYVLVDWQSAHDGRIGISLDCESAIFKAMMYLVDKGHEKIAFLGSDHLPHYYLRCFNGYQHALDEKQLPIYPGWIHNAVRDVESAAQSVEKLMGLQTPPTAVCCMGDMCAVYFLQAAAQMGVPVPEKISVMSIDDILLSRYAHPPLTTISYNKDEIGREAAQLLLKMLNGEPATSVVINSDTIRERETVAVR